MPKLKDWSFSPFQFATSHGLFSTPIVSEAGVAHGDCYNDEKQRFKDGTYVATSLINNIDFENRTIKTRNTLYELGAPDPVYLAWCRMNDIDTSKFENWKND